MARMTAAEAAVRVMELEGVTQAFGVPGAAINPLYAALRQQGTIAHILARHAEVPMHTPMLPARARGFINRPAVPTVATRQGAKPWPR